MKRLRLYQKIQNKSGCIERKIIGVQPLDDAPGTFIMPEKQAILKSYIKFEQTIVFLDKKIFDAVVEFLTRINGNDEYYDIEQSAIRVNIVIFQDPVPQQQQQPTPPPKGSIFVPGKGMYKGQKNQQATNQQATNIHAIEQEKTEGTK